MAGHGFAGFDPEQAQAVVTIVNGLANTVETELAGAVAQFKNDLVTTDVVMGTCDYKENQLSGLCASLDKVMENLKIRQAVESFNKKVDVMAQKVGVTFNKNAASAEEAMAVLQNKAAEQAKNLGTSKGNM